jgi:hypothetical protein
MQFECQNSSKATICESCEFAKMLRKICVWSKYNIRDIRYNGRQHSLDSPLCCGIAWEYFNTLGERSKHTEACWTCFDPINYCFHTHTAITGIQYSAAGRNIPSRFIYTLYFFRPGRWNTKRPLLIIKYSGVAQFGGLSWKPHFHIDPPPAGHSGNVPCDARYLVIQPED